MNGTLFRFHKAFWLIILILWICFPSNSQAEEQKTVDSIKLAVPHTTGEYTVEETLWKRHSTRSFTSQTLNWDEIGQLCWAAQGINRKEDQKRTVPSAGATYPLVLYTILPDGIYEYLPQSHSLQKVKSATKQDLLAKAGLRGEMFDEAACIFVFGAIMERTTNKYGSEGRRYVYLEAGHAAQSLLLQAIALNLGGVPCGASLTEMQKQALGIPAKEEAVYILVIGHPKK